MNPRNAPRAQGMTKWPQTRGLQSFGGFRVTPKSKKPKYRKSRSAAASVMENLTPEGRICVARSVGGFSLLFLDREHLNAVPIAVHIASHPHQGAFASF